MVYDEITKDWAPRWGSNSVKKIQDDAEFIIEAKPGDDIYQDPFEQKSIKKQLEKEKH
jgi:hypothetical protein